MKAADKEERVWRSSSLELVEGVLAKVVLACPSNSLELAKGLLAKWFP